MNEESTHRKVSLVTGANKGIGRGVAEQLSALGMTVVIGARDPLRGEAAAAALREAGGDAHAVTLDVTPASPAPDTCRPKRPRSSPRLRRPGHGPGRVRYQRLRCDRGDQRHAAAVAAITGATHRQCGGGRTAPAVSSMAPVASPDLPPFPGRGKTPPASKGGLVIRQAGIGSNWRYTERRNA